MEKMTDIHMTDIHCHILPYVDDGADTLEVSLNLLRLEAEQGVGTVCLTPHLREEMFETPDRDIVTQYRRLQQAARERNIPIELYLSREYFLTKTF